MPTTRTVDNFILGLRKKLEDNPSSPVHVISVRDVGYKFVSLNKPEQKTWNGMPGYHLLDILFVMFQTSLTLFNIFGWIWEKTRLQTLNTSLPSIVYGLKNI